MDRAFSPSFSLAIAFLGLAPQADIDRAFSALNRPSRTSKGRRPALYQPGASPRIRINKNNPGLKARSIVRCSSSLKAVRLTGEGLTWRTELKMIAATGSSWPTLLPHRGHVRAEGRRGFLWEEKRYRMGNLNLLERRSAQWEKGRFS